jgi:hypothetical protein
MSATSLPRSISSSSSALPAPLSPDQFGDQSGGAVTASQPGTMLSQADRTTLQTALQMLKSARADASSVNAKTAAAGRNRLVDVVCYLVGFFDSRGWLAAAPVSPGLLALFGGSFQPSLDASLDDLETSLESTLAAPDTRFFREIGAAVSAVGDACIAVGAALVATVIGA